MTVKREELGVAPDGMLVCKLCREPLGMLAGGDLSGIEAAISRATEEHSCEAESE
jgi:hypothetical protein